MPVHGPAPHLIESITSVIDQELTSWELILVLDRPSQELMELADQMVTTDNRINKIISPGAGIVDALNFGLNFANAELIARLDSDDLMESVRLSIQANYFLGSPELACVGSQMSFINEDGNYIGSSSYPVKYSEIRKHLRYQICG